MKAIKKILTPVSTLLDTVCSAAIVFMLGAMVVITGAQIICRTWFTALSWSDEVTRYLLIWSTFLGATVVYRHGGHISVTFLQDAVKPKAAKALRIDSCIPVSMVIMMIHALLMGTEEALTEVKG